MFEQLLSNAIKYTPPGGEIAIYLIDNTTLCIQDTGIGISSQDLPRIFEKGYTGFNGRADKKASGLGLYLCRRISMNLGLDIKIESVPNQGTKVIVSLLENKMRLD